MMTIEVNESLGSSMYSSKFEQFVEAPKSEKPVEASPPSAAEKNIDSDRIQIPAPEVDQPSQTQVSTSLTDLLSRMRQ
jgi:hypothetical protein